MYKIKCSLDEEGYIRSYTDAAFKVEGEFVEVIIRDEYLSKKVTMVDDIIVETNYILKDFFEDNFMFFKVENNVAIFDPIKKKDKQITFINRNIHDVRIEILKQEELKRTFESNGWDTSEIVKELESLHIKEQELLDLLNSIN